MNIEIDQELKEALKPLDAEERAGLKALIESDGKIISPLIVWETSEGRQLLVDGHHRREIAEELGVSFKVERMKFASRAEAIRWIQKHQANRRNVSKGEAAILRGKKAIAQKAAHGENLKKPNENKRAQVGLSCAEPKKPLSEIAKDEGVSVSELKRNITRAEVHSEVEKVDPVAAKAIVEMPQREVEEIKKAVESKAVETPEEKPAVVAEEVKKRVAAPKPEPIVIDGACDELRQLVQSGAVSVKVAENLVEQVPGQAAQAKLVSKGVEAVKRASVKPREETPKAPPKVTEAQVIAFLQDADTATKSKIMTRVFRAEDEMDRKAIFGSLQKTFTEKERFNLIGWAREQDSNIGSEMTAKELSVIATRAKVPHNHKHRRALVKKLLDNPDPKLIEAMKKWSHDQFTGKDSLFVPPTEEEVREYAQSLDKKKYPDATADYRVDKFFEFHEASGWTYGNTRKPVKDWKARYRTSLSWEVPAPAKTAAQFNQGNTVGEIKERIKKETEAKIARGETVLTLAGHRAIENAKRIIQLDRETSGVDEPTTVEKDALAVIASVQSGEADMQSPEVRHYVTWKEEASVGA